MINEMTTAHDARQMTGAQMVIQALIDQSVTHIFGYPGGAVLPIYDELFKQNKLQHILVRHEQCAGHAAEGYARSSGKCGVMLVTSGPGGTNAVTPLADAMLDSIPLICISGQVATNLIGSDAFQEADIVGITRPCTKHSYLVKSVNDLADILHEAFHIATSGRPGPVVIDIPKDVQFAIGEYRFNRDIKHRTYRPRMRAADNAIDKLVAMCLEARKPVFYTGGGVISSGTKASEALRQLVKLTDFPVTSTLMGLGAFPASDNHWLGMLGMHGTYEANNAMHDCDLMICVGARFDDRITGKLDAFSPNSKKIHIDVDPSSINKNVMVDLPIIADCGLTLMAAVEKWQQVAANKPKPDLDEWWQTINNWRAINSLSYKKSDHQIKPQFAIERLYHAIKATNHYITTEVGQHQMWAAQHFHFDEPNRWMTSGGLGTMGYGIPAAIGAQVAHPDALVVDIAGEASAMMTIQELSTAVQHNLPVKIFIINNQYMGMVRQWQELIHGGRYSHSYSEALPDFVRLGEAFGCLGIRCENPHDLDQAIDKMINYNGPVLFDCVVTKEENCFPMIPSGKAHNEMILDSSVSAADSLNSDEDNYDKTLV